jgi:hypothetical protein
MKKKVSATDCFGNKVTIELGKTYTHDRLGKVTVVALDSKHGEPIAILSCGEWCRIVELR